MSGLLWFHHYISPLLFVGICTWSIYKRMRWTAVSSFVAVVLLAYGLRRSAPGLAYATFTAAAMQVFIALVLWGRDAKKVRW